MISSRLPRRLQKSSKSTNKPTIPSDSNASGDTNDSHPSNFHLSLQSSEMPPPGPDYYLARRQLWLNARPVHPRGPPAQSSSRQRLESLLNNPDAVDCESVWKGGVEKVYRGLSAGGRLKRPLPMPLILKVIHAAWLRDPETWPPGTVAPDPDDFLGDVPTDALASPTHSGAFSISTRTEFSTSTSAVWTPVSAASTAETSIGDETPGLVADTVASTVI